MGYLVNAVIGALGGWLMGQLGKGSGFGDIGNVLSGIVGGIGAPMLGVATGLLSNVATTDGIGGIGSWIASAAGSAVLPMVIGMFNKKS